MPIQVTPAAIPEVLVIDPALYGDARGYFLEVWHQVSYKDFGMPLNFVQDNVSRSQHGILRGLHLQHPFGQGKLVHVLEGEVFDVAVDVRLGSPTFGRWVGECLSGENHRQLYIPAGFAHGFCVISPHALVAYKVTELYHQETELGIAWNDPDLGVEWPIGSPQLSLKDSAAPRLRDVPHDRLPRWGV